MYTSISHELRTPINIILNCLILLSGKVGKKFIKWIKIAESSSKLLLSLVNDTLDFA